MAKKAAPKKRGRPAKPGGKDPVVPARLPLSLVEAIDTLAAANGVTRSEAMRQLIEAGLKRKAK